MAILLVGLILNFSVITANGGFMPISPQTAEHLVDVKTIATMETGSRFGFKDILLSKSDTRLEWLADHFLLPEQFPFRAAFSLGDIFIGAGAFWILASPKPTIQE